MIPVQPAIFAEKPSRSPRGAAMMTSPDDCLLRPCVRPVPALLAKVLSSHYPRTATRATVRIDCRLGSRTDQWLSASPAEIEIVRIFQIAGRAEHDDVSGLTACLHTNPVSSLRSIISHPLYTTQVFDKSITTAPKMFFYFLPFFCLQSFGIFGIFSVVGE